MCISLSELAAAVANEGGVGVIAANAIGMLEKDYFKNCEEANRRALRNEIRKFKAKSDGVLGVNLMVIGNDTQRLLEICCEERVDILFLGAGLPIKDIPIEKIRQASVKVVPIVSSARAANLIFKFWKKTYNDLPDGVVLEGPLAGGHLGFKPEQIDDPKYALENMLPDLVDTISMYEKDAGYKIPVIAAGGIYDGKDIFKMLKLGASGVQMGTRFVATHECDADIQFKKTYVQCKKEDIKIIQSPVGLPGRAIDGEFFNHAIDKNPNLKRCPWKCLAHCDAENAKYCIAIALNFARKGDLKNGFAFAGQNAYRINKIVSVKDLISALQRQHADAAKEITRNLKYEYDRIMDKLTRLKTEYMETLPVLKEKCGSFVSSRGESLRGEMKEIMQNVTELKQEYIKYLEEIKSLSFRLAQQYS